MGLCGAAERLGLGPWRGRGFGSVRLAVSGEDLDSGSCGGVRSWWWGCGVGSENGLWY